MAALDWSTIQAALIAWVAAATGAPTYWADPDAPMPAKPCARLQITSRDASPGQPGGDEWQTAAASPGVVTFAVHRTHTLSVQVFSNATTGATAAAVLLGNVARALNTDTRRLALRQAGVKVTQAGPTRDLTAALETRPESRAQADFRLATVDTFAEDQSWIETVNTTGVAVAKP